MLRTRLIRACLAILALAATPLSALAGTISGVNQTSGFFGSFGMGWADTLFNQGVNFVFGPGLMIGGGYALMSGINKMRQQQEKGEWLNAGILTTLTLGMAAGGVGLWNYLAHQTSKPGNNSAPGFVLHALHVAHTHLALVHHLAH